MMIIDNKTAAALVARLRDTDRHGSIRLEADATDTIEALMTECEAFRRLLIETAVPAIMLARLDLTAQWQHLSKSQIDSDPTIQTLDIACSTIREALGGRE